jgi:glucose/arabinose dehydrogenase
MKHLAAAAAAVLALPGTAAAQDGDHSAILDRIDLPDGFAISVFAEMPMARSIELVEPAGTVFVGSREGHVYAMIDDDHDGVADEVRQRAGGLNVPNGIASLDGQLYIALQDKVVRAPAEVDADRPLGPWKPFSTGSTRAPTTAGATPPSGRRASSTSRSARRATSAR